MEKYIKNVVQSAEDLIRPDVYEVLELCLEADRSKLSEWLISQRPDLEETVQECVRVMNEEAESSALFPYSDNEKHEVTHSHRKSDDDGWDF